MKQCRDCGEFKSFSEFYPHHNTKDGFRAVCKECYRKIVASRRMKILSEEQCRQERTKQMQQLCDKELKLSTETSLKDALDFWMGTLRKRK